MTPDRQARIDAGRQRVALMLAEWVGATAPPGPLSAGRRAALADLGLTDEQLDHIDAAGAEPAGDQP